MLLVFLAFGFVLDRDQSCAAWARADDCHGENGDVVRRLCPLSCNVAGPNGRDSDTSCGGWRKDDACSNPAVQKLCPTSCGLASPLCPSDTSSECETWAAAGECVANSYMHTNCARACGVCKSSCVDSDPSCPYWVFEGLHNQNPGAVLTDCSHSAGTCGDDLAEPTECEDTNATACASWGADECQRTPAFMLRQCPETCGVCRSLCVDKSSHCHGWAADGECETNSGVPVSCPQSCGVCSLIEQLSQRKDEL